MNLIARKEGSKLVLKGYSWSQILARLKDGDSYQVTIKKPTKHRTNKQNSTYHLLRKWWMEMQKADGNIYTDEQSEYWFKYWFGWMELSEFIDENGEVHEREVPKSTKNLTTEQMSTIYMLIVDKAQEWWPGCIVPVIEFN